MTKNWWTFGGGTSSGSTASSTPTNINPVPSATDLPITRGWPRSVADASPPGGSPDRYLWFDPDAKPRKKKKAKWRDAYDIEGAPSWWKGLVKSGVSGKGEYGMIYNAMIPFLSTEDQRTAALNLQNLFGNSGNKLWESYNTEKSEFDTPTTEITSDITEKFTSTERAQAALNTLDQVANLAKKNQKKFGGGYKFLRQLLQTMIDYGGGQVGAGNRQTRAQYKQMRAALEPLLAQTKSGELQNYAGIAQQLTSPYFSAGNVVPISKDAAGNYIFGSPNKGLYG